MNTILIILVFIAALCCGVVYWIYKQSIGVLSPAYKRNPVTIFPDQFKLPFENITFTTSDKIKIKGWFIPYPGSAKTIFLMHGWGHNRGDVFKNTYYLRDL